MDFLTCAIPIWLLSSTWKGVPTSCTWKHGAWKHQATDSEGQRLILLRKTKIWKEIEWSVQQSTIWNCQNSQAEGLFLTAVLLVCPGLHADWDRCEVHRLRRTLALKRKTLRGPKHKHSRCGKSNMFCVLHFISFRFFLNSFALVCLIRCKVWTCRNILL